MIKSLFKFRKKSKAKRYKYGKKNLLDGGIKVFKLLSFVMVIVGVIYFFFGSSLFLLKEIKLNGYSKFLNKKQMINLAKVPFEENIFKIDLSILIKNIKRFPWVQDVSIRRQLPDQLIIQISEYTPMAILEVYDSNIKETKYYLMSDKGKIFTSIFDVDKWKLPRITGFNQSTFEKFPNFSKNILNKSFHDLLGFYQLSKSSSLRIEELNYDFVEGLTIRVFPPPRFNTDEEMKLYFGKRNYKEIEEVWTFFEKRVLSESLWYREVDFHVPGKIFARL